MEVQFPAFGYSKEKEQKMAAPRDVVVSVGRFFRLSMKSLINRFSLVQQAPLLNLRHISILAFLGIHKHPHNNSRMQKLYLCE